MGSEHQQSAGFGVGQAQDHVPQAPEVSIRDPPGSDHCRGRPQFRSVPFWSCVRPGQEHRRATEPGDTTNRCAPAPVDCLNLKKTVLISCGGEHTVVLTKGSVVFTFGSGRYGQLAHNSLRDELRPRVVAQLCGLKVTQIACGRHHTLAFVRPSNKIYSFGCGEQGQLGNGVKIDQSVPLPVQLPDQIDDQKIEHIFAGGNHSFALCTLGQEITKMFSSASCLNGSFLDKSLAWICLTGSWRKRTTF
ncbi:probable E3 ubiquitin-protein ligase HERC3 isoform X2 [Oncorhynchus masou masou]|uniref:probable E3 ubiquitin-protein ligase HERC3 isoform X2 n=1 Tax=Oncorhynchus masou masou TaxID=90313 RepID=UPI0031831036